MKKKYGLIATESWGFRHVFDHARHGLYRRTFSPLSPVFFSEAKSPKPVYSLCRVCCMRAGCPTTMMVTNGHISCSTTVLSQISHTSSVATDAARLDTRCRGDSRGKIALQKQPEPPSPSSDGDLHLLLQD